MGLTGRHKTKEVSCEESRRESISGGVLLLVVPLVLGQFLSSLPFLCPPWDLFLLLSFPLPPTDPTAFRCMSPLSVSPGLFFSCGCAGPGSYSVSPPPCLSLLPRVVFVPVATGRNVAWWLVVGGGGVSVVCKYFLRFSCWSPGGRESIKQPCTYF